MTHSLIILNLHDFLSSAKHEDILRNVGQQKPLVPIQPMKHLMKVYFSVINILENIWTIP